MVDRHQPKIHYDIDRIRGDFQEAFIKRIPVGSVVWCDNNKKHFATTKNSRIYVDPDDEKVTVIDVDGISGRLGVWFAADIILKED